MSVENESQGQRLAARAASGSWWPITDAEHVAEKDDAERLWAEHDARLEHDWSDED